MSSGENIFANPERWAEPIGGGNFMLTEPTTGDRLNPNIPPAWMEEDPYLHAGFEYLRMNGPNIAMQIAYGPHGAAEDLGNPALGWFEKKVAEADYYAYEACGYTEKLMQQSHNNSSLLLRTLYANQRRTDFASYSDLRKRVFGNMDAFQHRMDYAIAKAGDTVSFPADVARDGRPIEQAFWDARTQMLFKDDITPGLVAATTGMILHRDWFALAKTGLKMLEKEATQSPYRDINGFMTYGMYHKDIERKYRSMHVTVPRTFKARPDAWDENIVDYFRDMAATGVVLSEGMPMLTVLHRSTLEAKRRLAKKPTQ